MCLPAAWSLAVALACAPADVPPDAPDEALWDAFVAGHADAYARFVALLTREGVADVVPPWTLWRQGTDWRAKGEDPFVVPPEADWSSILPTLRVLRDDVVPRVGPVDVVSGYRTVRYNVVADGAPGSRHQWFEAVDVVPKEAWTREDLHRELLLWWDETDEELGLGLYGGVRFHVDVHRHRRW